MTQNSQVKESSNQPEAQASGMPLFYQRPYPLDAKRHAKAGLIPSSDFSFAKATNSVTLNVIEFIEAAKTYPIVFTADDNSLPTAIVGLEKNNYFLQENGNWMESAYIPAYLRQYPFVFFEQPEENKFYLSVDEAAPQFTTNVADEKSANRLYKDDGEPSDFTNNALQFCSSFYQHHLISRNFCADLKEHKLLSPYQSEIRLPSGRSIQLGGFQMIDENAVNALPEKTFLEFRTKGWLPFIYFALASISNWKRLVDMAAKAETTEK